MNNKDVSADTEKYPVAAQMLEEYKQIEAQMATPKVLADAGRLRSLSRRYAQLGRVVGKYTHWLDAARDLREAREIVDMGGEDAQLFAPEVPRLEQTEREAAASLRDALIPRDPDDLRDVILEVKAGEGGEESALFAGDLLRMYQRYAESKGWSTQILSATPTDLGGYKDVQIAVKAKNVPEDPADLSLIHI